MTSYDYDLIVIGDGSGRISSANLGKKVALVEKISVATAPGTDVCRVKL